MSPKKMHLITGVAIVAVALLAACKSTPPAEPEPAPAVVEPAVEPAVEPEPSVVVAPAKPVDEALTTLRDECEALREKGLKYGIDSFKPEGWSEADASRNAGLAAYGSDYDLSEASFKDAIQKYDALFTTAFEEISGQLESDLVAARNKAIAAGADAYFPEQFAIADQALAEASDHRDAAHKEESYLSAQVALMRYQTLILGMEAVALNDDIVRNGFAVNAPDDYEVAGLRYEESAAAYGSADAQSYEAAAECVAALNRVSNAGYQVLSAEKIERVNEIRSLCDSIKAGKSMPKEYAAAGALAQNGDESGKGDDWKTAYNAYLDAETAFTAVYQEVSLRRNAADLAISSAKNKQDESSDLARQADEVAPLPENADGFSDEPYVIESASGEEPK